jgi:hypothetical protein
MKTILVLLAVLMGSEVLEAQITSSAIKANFGVDGELQANYYGAFGSLITGNDDWFINRIHWISRA